MSKTTFILIPGGWHSAACWQRVVPLLEAQGYCVITPELLGMGSDPTPPGNVKLVSWVDQIADLLREQEQAVILVGHSRGGLIISEVAERVPEKVKLLVYLAAFLLQSGETLLSTVPKEGGKPFFTTNPDGTASIVPDQLVPVLYSGTPSEWAERAASLMSPEPISTFVTPVQLTDDRYGRVARAYIECKQDQALSLARQRSMQERLPCKYVITMDTDHSPFFSAPSELAANLIDLASKE